METHTRYYQLAGITFKVISDLPILESTFDSKFKHFEITRPGKDTITIHHHFEPRAPSDTRSWVKIYDQSPWEIYHFDQGWVYKRIHRFHDKSLHHCTAFFNQNHTHVQVYNEPVSKKAYTDGGVDALTLFPTDQVLLARILADRNGCFFHSNGVVFKGKGLLFLGHSGYGKSTIAKMLCARGGKRISDDRTIVLNTAQGFNMHGSWCHGKERVVSSKSSLLDGIFFLTQSDTNEITLCDQYKHNLYSLISFIIKPLVTRQWWENNFSLIESIAQDTPCYNLAFDKSGDIVDLIDRLY